MNEKAWLITLMVSIVSFSGSWIGGFADVITIGLSITVVIIFSGWWCFYVEPKDSTGPK